MRGVAHFRKFVKNAGTDVEHERNARGRGRSIERGDLLRRATLENTEIIPRESANLRSIRRGHRASYLHESYVRTDCPVSRGVSRRHRRIQLARNRIAFERRIVAQ